ncbi:MAG: endopeptidase La [Bacteroidetes bacterium]|nr:endopeptidase La [Bacteroidota bacterium]
MLAYSHDPIRLADEFTDEAIPLPTPDEEQAMRRADLPETLPILTLRNTVLFPGVVLPITVGRDTSLKLVKDAFAADKLIGVVAQKDADTEEPGPDDLHTTGTLATILKLIKMPDGSKSIVIQGRRRFEVQEYVQSQPYLRAKVAPLDEPPFNEDDAQGRARMAMLKELAVQIVHLSPHLPSEAAFAIQNIESPAFLVHFIASNLQTSADEKQAILATPGLGERADLVLDHLKKEIQMLQLSEEIRSKVRTDVDKQQREFLLRQQMKAIQDELGEDDGGEDLAELRAKAAAKDLPPHVRKALDKELDKLARLNPMAPDHAVTRNYIDWILDTPWTETSEDHLDLHEAERILDADHYGLEQVKRRILEYLAVLKLKGDMKAPILCFYGPPGVGKTSLGKSIAHAIGREFVRMSLGGVRDEAELRGHRRTYVGALPGRIIQGLKKAGTSNPVFMLDEVDKLGNDFRGDPASALLEILDPEQNNAFNDHYLELDYDLSKVLFIATANYIEQIPAPLRDRMEMIEITGYTQDEKLAIARQYLVPRQKERNGLKDDQLAITDDALFEIIDGYTRESGVRQLEQKIGSVARGVAAKIAKGTAESATVDVADVEAYLDGRDYFSDVAERTDVPGVATGLAWTPVGGDILFVEASVSQGTGRMILTGKLGDVMRESAQAAYSWVRSHADDLGIPQDAFRYWDLHVHVPAGAIPKDGPSAGVAMTTALASIFTQRRVRHDVAMTGEISLRGLVLPVGGIKEKTLAAKRAGITTLVLPERNQKDVKEMKEGSLDGVTVHYVTRIREALEHTLEPEPIRDPQLYFRVPESDKRAADASAHTTPPEVVMG